jgi:DNA recombination protein RmuC
MDLLLILSAFVVGVIVGVGIVMAFGLMQRRTATEIAHELFRESELQRQAGLSLVMENLKDSFGKLSLDALAKSTEEFLKLAAVKLDSERQGNTQALETKKELIDRQLLHMTSELENVSKLMMDLEQDRSQKFGELTNQLQNSTQQTQALMHTTNSLREALGSTKARGQWGERMAEDVLRLAGLIENINYVKQKTIDAGRLRPDFTFLLPKSLKLHMDVKFPLDNYLRFLEAPSEAERAKFRSDFIRDVKARIKECTSRDYIDPEVTVDYVLLFIPNEQIYAFIYEHDCSVLDDGIKNKVVFCSPMTLFAVLAVIRQAVDNFSLEKTSNEVLSHLGSFKKQWDEFVCKWDLLGRRLGEAMKEYDALSTVRRRQLEKPLHRIEELRTLRGLPVCPDEETLAPTEERNEIKASYS